MPEPEFLTALKTAIPALQDPMLLMLVFLGVGWMLGMLITWLGPVRNLRRQIRAVFADWRETEADLQKAVADKLQLQSRLDAETKAHEARLAELRQAQAQMQDSFSKLANDALHKNADSFLKLVSERYDKHKTDAGADMAARQKAIEALVKPIAENLHKVEAQLNQVERTREGAYQQIKQQIATMHQGHEALRRETGNLVQALRAPKTRGRWGEFQLQQVFEMADMQQHVNFELEFTLPDASRRPDALVNLPGGKCIIVDAKTPLDAYLNATEAQSPDEQRAFLAQHAKQLRTHVQQLSAKEYWNALPQTPDFVIMFVPGEAFYSAAIEHDPALWDFAVRNKVIIASPTTLIALLKSVGYGWQQERLAENAQKVADTARELYARIGTYGDHMQRMGKSLHSAVEHYNKSVGSLERSVLPSARKFEALDVTPAGESVAELSPLETEPRSLSAPELTERD